MICFTARVGAQQLVDALRPARPLLLHCGTIWVHGPAARVPVTEDEPRTAYGEYGTGKAAIEALLHRETIAGGVPSVVLHPGHISGPGLARRSRRPATSTRTSGGGWRPASRWRCPASGSACSTTCTPTTSRRRSSARSTRPAAIGASFHVVAEQAMTLRGLAAGVAAWFGREPVIELVDWPEFERRVGGRARGGDARARRPQHRREHRPGARRARLRAALQRRSTRCTRRSAGSSPAARSTSAGRASRRRGYSV